MNIKIEASGGPGAFETWAPTNQLKWFKVKPPERTSPFSVATAYLSHELKQLWFSDRGAQEWRLVEREE